MSKKPTTMLDRKFQNIDFLTRDGYEKAINIVQTEFKFSKETSRDIVDLWLAESGANLPSQNAQIIPLKTELHYG